MVAWHKVPGIAEPRIRPVGYGVTGGSRHICLHETMRFQVWLLTAMPSGHTLTGLILKACFPRHFVPGYHRLVPPAHEARTN